jgi:hypothetical protein
MVSFALYKRSYYLWQLRIAQTFILFMVSFAKIPSISTSMQRRIRIRALNIRDKVKSIINLIDQLLIGTK